MIKFASKRSIQGGFYRVLMRRILLVSTIAPVSLSPEVESWTENFLIICSGDCVQKTFTQIYNPTLTVTN